MLYIYIHVYTGQEKYWTSNLSAYWLVHLRNLCWPTCVGKEVTVTKESHNQLLQRISTLSLMSTHVCQSPMFGHVRCIVSFHQHKMVKKLLAPCMPCFEGNMLSYCRQWIVFACSVGCLQICGQQSVRRCPWWRKGSRHRFLHPSIVRTNCIFF